MHFMQTGSSQNSADSTVVRSTVVRVGSCAFHRPSTLHTALDMRPRKRCCVETACARARTMAPLTAVSLAASAVRDSRVCSAAPPACPTMVESRLNRHMGDSGVAQAAPSTLKIGWSAPLPRFCKIYSMCMALRKTLAASLQPSTAGIW